MELNKRNLERLGRLLRAAANEIRKLTAEPQPASLDESRQARCEAVIRRVMQIKKRLSVRELKDRTNYQRVGIAMWEKSLESLVQGGEVRVHEEPSTAGRIKRIVTLERL